MYYRSNGSIFTQAITPSETYSIFGSIDFTDFARRSRPVPTERLSSEYQSLKFFYRTRHVGRASSDQEIPHPKSLIPPFCLPLSAPLFCGEVMTKVKLGEFVLALDHLDLGILYTAPVSLAMLPSTKHV